MELRQTVEIINKLGLHARAATKLARVANKHDCEITIIQGENTAHANSVLALMMLQSSQGKEIDILCKGTDAREAMDELVALVQNKFDESE